ncbi:hypothetical protein GMST_35010 [Geomonas silvestris]|uniref:Uncharacterized protein n=1 Tax=Geomonas silvestris TaxID=2740184 RepID=A0A6V8MME5_9BACT|nr:hypothetical protein [Geomonas silvestris]GFO61176.1 hypothetical protein GMST_35010 [Geomonas silvestris]
MKKSEKEQGSALERIASEQAMRQRIAAITQELNQVGDVQALKIKAADARTRLESFIHRRGGIEQDITGRDGEDLKALKENLQESSAAAMSAAELEGRLRAELSDLQTRLNAFTFSASLAEVKDHQMMVASSTIRVNALEKAIQEQSQMISQNSGPNLEEISQRRESLLADAAMGIDVAEQLGEVEREIQLQEMDRSLCSKRVADADQCIKGLSLKLESEKATLTDLKQTGQALLLHFLKAEAESAGAEFVKAGQELKEGYMRLLGLDALINKLAPGQKVLGFYPRCPEVPVFDLKAFAGQESGRGTGLMISRTSFNPLAALADIEQRIKDLGLNL